MGITNVVEIASKERDSWEPITPEKVDKVYVRRRKEGNLNGGSSHGVSPTRIGIVDEDVREKEGSSGVTGPAFIHVYQDARSFACFDGNCCANSFNHFDGWQDVFCADRGAVGSLDCAGCLESNLAAPSAGQRMVEFLNSAHLESTPVFNSHIPPSSVDHQSTGQFVTSTPIHVDKSSKIGMNLDKTPRRKPKKKKHTPKVIREGKPRRILKRKDLSSETPSAKKKKHAREKIGDSRPSVSHIIDATPPLKDAVKAMDKCFEASHLHKCGGDSDISSKFATSQLEVKLCRRQLNFGANQTEDGKVADQHCANDSLVGTSLVHLKQDSYTADQTRSQVLPSPRCKAVNRKSLILDRIRRTGHNFPIKFKKRRAGRRKRTAAMKMAYMLSVLCPRDFYVSYPSDSKKKRTMKWKANRFECTIESQELEIPISHHAPVDANAIGVEFEGGRFANVDRQTSDGKTGKQLEKRKIGARGHKKHKGTKLKLQQELEWIVQKIMGLNIGDVENQEARQDEGTLQPQSTQIIPYKAKAKKKTKKKPPNTQGALVPYEAKTKMKAPRVEFDSETVRRWKQLMLLDDGGAEDEADQDRERKWARERQVFRGRVASFLARMHLILGDRHFTLWKGSVVDSIVGVYLTQNVSDYLSSNAYMALVSKFPCYPVNGGQNGDEEITDKIKESHNFLKQILEQIMEEEEPVSIQKSHNIFELILEKIVEREETMSSEANIRHEKGHAESQAFASVEKKNEATKRETKKKIKDKEKKTDPFEWEKLRKAYSSVGPRTANHMDSVDWDAVRRADVQEVAATIKERGQHNKLAERIQNFLNELVRKQGNIDLEWLRSCPPDKVKEYLLEIPGLGLKSVECVRLLALQHVAFPVDTNVGRIAVRLGWVPLEPLPENLQIHLLEKFPIMDEVQRYLWPRLRELDQLTLYELHYHLITFGKVFCMKTKPNCNACPLQGECKHFASAYASARLSLPAPKQDLPTNGENSNVLCNKESISALGAIPLSGLEHQIGSCEPIIEEPASPKIASKDLLERDIEDLYKDDGDEIMTINLSSANFPANLQSPLNDVGMFEENSRALVAINNFVPMSMPKLKEVTRLRTEHHVYELPYPHPLLRELPAREADDPCPYLLLLWTEDEDADSSKSTKDTCDFCPNTKTCDEHTCQEESYATIKGTLLIPCRTSLGGRFPLNGTYFQVNEVFADHESSHKPIDVPRRWIWNLPRRMVYFGTSASSIFKGLPLEKIQSCFWNGFICIRGIDRKMGAPRPLITRFHRQSYKSQKSKKMPT